MAGNSSPQNQGLPLQNTGVPDSQQISTGSDAQQIPVFSQVPAPQQAPAGDSYDKAALLSALSGAALNFMGAASGRGPVGQGAIEASVGLQSRGAEKRKGKYATDKEKYDAEKASEESKSLLGAIDGMYNPDYQAAAKVKAKYNDVAGIQQLLAQDRADARADRAEGKQSNQEISQLNTGLGLFEKGLLAQKKEYDKHINPDIDRSLIIQQSLSEEKAPPKDIGELKGIVNPALKKEGLPLLDTNQALSVLSQVTKAYSDKSPSWFSKVVGGAKDPSPKDAFADLVTNNFDPAALKAHGEAKDASQELLKQAQAARALRQQLMTKSEAAKQAAYGVLSSGRIDTPAKNQAPADDERVTVVNQQGKTGTIPKSQLKEAQAQGFKLKK